MNLTKNQNSSLLLALGLALIAVPGALAGDAYGKNHKGQAEERFKMTDTNGDGRISREEQAAAQKQMFTDMDTNHDGEVTVAEMTAAHAKMNAGMSGRPMKGEMTPTEMIKMHDTNQDGQLSAAEHAAACDMMFDKMDTNHDGSLSPEEYKEGAKMMKKGS